MGIALSQLALGQAAPAADTYRRLAAIDARGASIAAMGLADLALYQGRPADAVAELQKGIALDDSLKDADAAAQKRVALAEAHLARGRTREAARRWTRPSRRARGENILFPAARVYLATGRGAAPWRSPTSSAGASSPSRRRTPS